jgi:hypothetical protein
MSVTRGDLFEAVAAVKLEMARLHSESMAASSRLETRMAETKVELIRWFLGSLMAMGGAVTAIVRLMPH